MTRMPLPSRFARGAIFFACFTALGSAVAPAWAQSSCDSDRAARPVALLERFTSADCESCWADAATPKAARGEIAIDWVVPTQRGDDAPLSAVATRDAQWRLDALKRLAPTTQDAQSRGARKADRKLRVAHGLAFNGYIGTSMALQPGSGGPWHAWLLLVETLPAGTEGSPVERNLVRNAFQPAWDSTRPLSKKEQIRLVESRPMAIPEGARPERLRVVGWVEDSRGQIRAIAQSQCVRPRGQG